MKAKRSIFTIFLALVLSSLACGSVQFGVMTPTSDESLVKVGSEIEPVVDFDVLETSLPTDEPTPEPEEDFSHLWAEYRNPVLGYGLALPAFWDVQPEAENGFMIARSYDQAFFDANSIKGNWIGGKAPEGAVKLDFVPFTGVAPEQSLADAISGILGADPEMTVVLSVEAITIGSHQAVSVTTARPDNPEGTAVTNVAFRLAPDTILFVAAYPDSGHQLPDVQTALSTLVLDENTPVVKPKTAPQPPLAVKDEGLSGTPNAAAAFAWYGHIASLPAGGPYDDKLVLQFGAGEIGIAGHTPEIEAQIQSLRDAAGEMEFVHLWGTVYCSVDDVNACRLDVERLEYGDQYTLGSYPVENWVGRIKRVQFNNESVYAFELPGQIPVLYGIAAGDPTLQGQLESLAGSDTVVNVWGDLLVGVGGVNNTRIEMHRVEPPGPGALPSTAACESGYMGLLEETIELITTSLETGNYYPTSYTIGDPFVIGYWRSEGVSLPRAEAFQQLQQNFFPTPKGIKIVSSDPNQFPDLEGVSLDTVWGPDVEVAANLYSTGWGPDGQNEAIISIAQCDGSGGQTGYYWYGMLYGKFK